MLCVINHLSSVLDEVCDRVADHRLIFLYGGAQDLGDLEFPAFSENGDDRSFSL